jgi:hypothetical protein
VLSKEYKVKKPKMIFIVTAFGVGSLVGYALLILTLYIAFYHPQERNWFSIISLTVFSLGSFWTWRFIYNLTHRYEVEDDVLIIRRGRGSRRVEFKDLEKLLVDKSLIKFRDPSGKQYYITQDFADFNELVSFFELYMRERDYE